jgi:hypothetical protein
LRAFVKRQRILGCPSASRSDDASESDSNSRVDLSPRANIQRKWEKDTFYFMTLRVAKKESQHVPLCLVKKCKEGKAVEG